MIPHEPDFYISDDFTAAEIERKNPLAVRVLAGQKICRLCGESCKIRVNVSKHLPVLRRQITANGWGPIRECLEKGNTKFLSAKDRRQAIQILDGEFGRP